LKKFVVIVAGGSGSRMNAPVPKQFLLLSGKPVLMHSVQAFYETYADIHIAIALPPEQFDAWKDLCSIHAFHIVHQVTAGGETRFHSVKNALDFIPDEGMVAVHDGARPLISPLLISSIFETAREKGNAVPVIPVNESIRIITGSGNKPVNRQGFCIVQTPQVFPARILKKAYARHYSPDFTDDATVAEASGEKIHLVNGDRNNIKLTYPSDLVIAQSIFDAKKS